MLFSESFLIALSMLRQNKLRSFLTMLGVIIGVMSVTIIVMVSNGFTFFMTNEFKKLGSDTIVVAFDPGRMGRRETLGGVEGLTMDDVEYLENNVSSMDIASPIVQVPSKIRFADVEIDNARIYATDSNFQELNKLKVIEGRFFTKSDLESRANVCIIGEEIRDRCFPDKRAIGKYLTFNGITLEVIGILERIDMMGETNAKDALVPITTAQDKWLGGEKLMMITLRPKAGFTVDETMESVWQALMRKSGNRPVYRVDSRESIIKVFGAVFGVAGVVLSAIAALSLLVGGIGIMNIMLVSVTERTREIGLRKSVGAKRASILTQFLVEAATLSLVGGLIGMGFAWLLGNIVTFGTAAMKWPSAEGLPTPFPLTAAFGAAVFSAFIGMVFGLYPAISASRMDPITALRHE
jgi:putative ABC transport system permease protein